jgi:hypothetical protein
MGPWNGNQSGSANLLDHGEVNTASRSDCARDYEGDVRQRNEVRHKAQLPLLDVEAEAARLRQLDLDRAYENFFAHEMTPYKVRWDRPPTSWAESMGRMGAERRAEERMAPEIDRKWAEVVQAGTWVEWLEETKAEPASFSVWPPEDLTPPM